MPPSPIYNSHDHYNNQNKKILIRTFSNDVLSTSWKGAGSMWHLLKSTSLFSSSSSHRRCSSWVISIILFIGWGSKRSYAVKMALRDWFLWQKSGGYGSLFNFVLVFFFHEYHQSLLLIVTVISFIIITNSSVNETMIVTISIMIWIITLIAMVVMIKVKVMIMIE